MGDDELNVFLTRVPGVNELSSTELIDYFVYFITVIKSKAGATVGEISECFKTAHMTEYKYIPQYLSKKTVKRAGQKPSFIHNTHGYHLERSRKEKLDETLGVETIKRETSVILRELLTNLTFTSEREFLQEAINCYEIGAYRAAIIMCWILTLDHLYEYVFTKHLSAFNIELGKNTDKRVKVSVVTNRDDFGDIPENKFIEFCRAANIISNDVRKILDTKLGIRNSCAHPSGIKIVQVKASEFLQDLATNVVLKYLL